MYSNVLSVTARCPTPSGESGRYGLPSDSIQASARTSAGSTLYCWASFSRVALTSSVAVLFGCWVWVVGAFAVDAPAWFEAPGWFERAIVAEDASGCARGGTGSFCPTLTRSGSTRSLASSNGFRVTPSDLAMPLRVSPDCTTYSLGAPAGFVLAWVGAWLPVGELA